MKLFKFNKISYIIISFLLIQTAFFCGCTSTSQGTQQVDNFTLKQEIKFKDSLGLEVSLPATASRIISLNDDATELLVAIGAGDLIVGVTDTAIKKDLFNGKIPYACSIGDWQNPDIEKMLKLKPDIIIGYSTAKPKNIGNILASGLSVAFIDCYRLNDLCNDVQALGIITGKNEEAHIYTQYMQKYREIINSRLLNYSKDDNINIYAEAYSDYSVMTSKSAGGQILEALDIENIYGNHNSDWAKVNPEWIVGQNPDIIIKIASDPSKGEHLVDVRDRIMHRSSYSSINAVKEGRVYVINGDLASSPRSVIGLLYVAKVAYPDLFNDINPLDALEEYSREFYPGTEIIESFYPSI